MAVSLSLARLLAAAFPTAYADRQAEDATETDSCVGGVSAEANSPARAASEEDGEPETMLPLFYLDPMLPRQRLQLNIFEPRYRLMVRRCLEGSRRFGMLGVEWLTPLRHMGQRGVRHGVEVEIVENAPQADGRFHIEVLAGRRFEIIGGTWEQDGYAMATVRWIVPPSLRPARSAVRGPAPAGAATVTRDRDSESNGNAGERGDIGEYLAAPPDDADADTEDANEGVADSDSALAGSGPASPSARSDRDGDRASLDDATCIEMAAALDALVEEWKELLSTGRWERFHGQLGRSLADLGPMPPATDLDGTLHATIPVIPPYKLISHRGAGVVERSLWVGALINPLPGLGVAMEVRPLLLAAGDNPGEMVQIALEGIRGSIAHMTPSPMALWLRRQLARLDQLSWRDNQRNASLDWLWRFLTVAGAGGLLTLLFGTFVLVCLGIQRGLWFLLEAQNVTDVVSDAQPVDHTHSATHGPPPPPAFNPRDEV